MLHLTTGDYLSNDQHGFRAKRTCSNHLLEVINDWSLIVQRGDPVDAVYLDFQKAFDSVPHMRLLSKLESYGVSGKVLRWMRAFLTDRRQQVVVSGQVSARAPDAVEFHKARCSVPCSLSCSQAPDLCNCRGISMLRGGYRVSPRGGRPVIDWCLNAIE